MSSIGIGVIGLLELTEISFGLNKYWSEIRGGPKIIKLFLFVDWI